MIVTRLLTQHPVMYPQLTDNVLGTASGLSIRRTEGGYLVSANSGVIRYIPDSNVREAVMMEEAVPKPPAPAKKVAKAKKNK